MKIYFGGSIRGGRYLVPIYKGLITHLKRYGEVLTEHLGDEKIKVEGEKDLDDFQIHDRDMSWIKECDKMVVEVSFPSLGVGYEIREGIILKKPILALYMPQGDSKLSAMIAGCRNLKLRNYNNLQEGCKIMNEFFNEN
jgi:hypothetical protein